MGLDYGTVHPATLSYEELAQHGTWPPFVAHVPGDLSGLMLRPSDIAICRNGEGKKCRLGEGGFGVVYKAVMNGVDEVAVKLVKASCCAGYCTLVAFKPNAGMPLRHLCRKQQWPLVAVVVRVSHVLHNERRTQAQLQKPSCATAWCSCVSSMPAARPSQAAQCSSPSVSPPRRTTTRRLLIVPCS